MLPAMHTSKRPTKLTMVWEVLPNADPQAVHKAFAMLFRRRTSINELPEESAQTRGKRAELDKSY
jgi:hypothetical protein